MTLSTIRWDVDIVAQSSIVHRDEYTSVGSDTFTLFRREKVIGPDGQIMQIPLISGSSFRGVLRRIGEALTADVLGYEDIALPVPAAHLLTNGGRLAKSAHPLTDEEERHLKTLLPQIAVFGGAASGRVMSGLLSVSKVLPEVAELAHLLPRPPHSTPLLPAVLSVADESFTHLPDHRPTTGSAPRTDHADGSPLGRFAVETLPAGTRLQTWLDWTTPLSIRRRSSTTSWPPSPHTATSAAEAPQARTGHRHPHCHRPTRQPPPRHRGLGRPVEQRPRRSHRRVDPTQLTCTSPPHHATTPHGIVLSRPTASPWTVCWHRFYGIATNGPPAPKAGTCPPRPPMTPTSSPYRWPPAATPPSTPIGIGWPRSQTNNPSASTPPNRTSAGGSPAPTEPDYNTSAQSSAAE